MACSAEQRHCLLWSELLSQLVCRDNVCIEGGGDAATGYMDREPGGSEVATGRIAVTTADDEGRIFLLPDRLEVEWADGPSRSVPLREFTG